MSSEEVEVGRVAPPRLLQVAREDHRARRDLRRLPGTLPTGELDQTVSGSMMEEEEEEEEGGGDASCFDDDDCNGGGDDAGDD